MILLDISVVKKLKTTTTKNTGWLVITYAVLPQGNNLIQNSAPFNLHHHFHVFQCTLKNGPGNIMLAHIVTPTHPQPEPLNHIELMQMQINNSKWTIKYSNQSKSSWKKERDHQSPVSGPMRMHWICIKIVRWMENRILPLMELKSFWWVSCSGKCCN